MKKKVRGALVLVATMAFALALGAQAAPTTTWGAPDCGKWISQPSVWQKSWLLGYLSGMNEVWTGLDRAPQNPVEILSSADQAYVWMDNYCRKNPLETVPKGALELFFELVKKKRESQ